MSGTEPRAGDGLNPAQREAVSTLRGPLLVLAGAGTGKTRVVTYRIANLIRHGTLPQRILAVTFTNKAAGEMRERIGHLLGLGRKGSRGNDEAKPVIGTFHSHCVGVLRRHAKAIEYPNKFTIYDRGDQESLARTVLRDLRLPGTALNPNDLLMIISNWKNASVRPDQAAGHARTDKEHLAASAYRRYQKVCSSGVRWTLTICCSTPKSCLNVALRCWNKRQACSIMCWSMNIKIPTVANIASSRISR